MANTKETVTHGGAADTETVTQKIQAHQTSTVRKAVTQTRPAVTQTETLVRTLFPK